MRPTVFRSYCLGSDYLTHRPEDLAAAIGEQRILVARHAREHLPAFEQAVGELPGLVESLGLGRYLGAVVIDHKPRLLYRFLASHHSPSGDLGPQVILKVYGDQPRGEGPLLQVWNSRNLNVPRLLCGEIGQCTWLLMECLEFRPVSAQPTEQLEIVDQLARMGRVMHRPSPHLLPLLRPLDQVMVPRWEQAVLALRQSGYDIPSSWSAKAIAAYLSGDPVPLHGDLARANIGLSESGRLILFDASALLGSSSFDAARWSARAGTGEAGPEVLLDRWLSVEKLLSSPEAWELLAAECVLEAGSREIVRARAAQREDRGSAQSAETGVPKLLSVTARQWP